MGIAELIGKTLTAVRVEDDKSRVYFETDSGETYTMFHNQDCCEDVSVEDIVGDLSDLIGSPITQADESSNSDEHPEGKKPEYTDESFTWTFYRLATAKGSVVIRWYGSSNGWYSESVDLVKV